MPREVIRRGNPPSAWTRILELLSDGKARSADAIAATMPDLKQSTIATLLSLEANLGRKIAARRADTTSNRKVYYLVEKAGP